VRFEENSYRHGGARETSWPCSVKLDGQGYYVVVKYNSSKGGADKVGSAVEAAGGKATIVHGGMFFS
jgi:hypothetical protein